MGEVWRAQDNVLGRDVAVKMLHASLASDSAFIDRFRQEARAAALLNHPNIVAVYDWGVTPDGTYYMVMELVEGHTVRELLVEHGRLEPAQAADVLSQTLAALEVAHREGIVHRDIKPENLLVTNDGVVKVADFGLARAYAEARLTQAPGTVTGTVQYLAPEQVQGEPADPRTDLYSLGVVAYELLTGTVPFKGETSVAIAYKHVREQVPAPSRAAPGIPAPLDALVSRATEKDRERRPQTASEVRQDIRLIQSTLPAAPPLSDLVRAIARVDIPLDRAPTVTIPQTAPPPQGGRGAHGRPRKRRRRPLIWIAALLLIALAAAGAWRFLLTAEVPDVSGMTRAAAEQTMGEAGLSTTFGEGVYSTEFERGTVAEQSPGAGSRALRFRDVELQLSLGPRTVPVPDLIGMTEAEARKELGDANLAVGAVRTKYSTTIRSGSVMGQDPDDGRAEAGSPVDLTLSQGPPPISMPEVQGLPEEQAAALLADLDVQREERYSEEVKRGVVISQTPKPGAPVFEGDTVSIVVSLGPKNFPMPDVVGDSASAARNKLEDLGLKVNTSTVAGSSGGTVVGQQPSAGATVKAGQTVTLILGL
jgi:serine/threonine-protein kinase